MIRMVRLIIAMTSGQTASRVRKAQAEVLRDGPEPQAEALEAPGEVEPGHDQDQGDRRQRPDGRHEVPPGTCPASR